MHILVTGAGGLIGRSVVRKARARGWRVTAFARRACNEADRIGDLRQPIQGWPTPDALVHLAGGYAGSSAAELARADITIARNLIAWGGRPGVRRWVLASAAEVYGVIVGEADENWPCRPVIPYGRVKLDVEKMFQAAELPSLAICRLGEVYGRGSRILGELGGRLRRGFCPWPGDGRVNVSFLHVDDAAEALLLACERDVPGCQTYNVAGDQPATWRHFLDCIADLLDSRRALYLPEWAARCYARLGWSADRLFHRPEAVTPYVLQLLTTPKVLSSARLRDQLGFRPQYPAIRSGLEEALIGL
ncbi:MAG: NAD-dependent epimerase/dehydratase family protein [Bryobacteraceae bacterium]